MILTYQNSIQGEIKSRLKSGMLAIIWCRSFAFCLLTRNLKVKIYKTIILPVVLYGCDTWSLTLREEHRLKISQNRLLRRIFGPKRDKVAGSGGNYIMKSLMICTPHPILCGRLN